MKEKTVLKLTSVAILILIICVQFGCKKDNDNTTTPKFVWAVGDTDTNNYATIYFSTDGGQTWERQGEDQAALKGIGLNDVWAVDENTVWAVGTPARLIKTKNGGQDWEVVSTPTLKNVIEYVSISIINKSSVWICGSYGTIIHSGDAGQTWDKHDSEVLKNNYLQGINAITTNSIYVVGGPEDSDAGFIAFTTNGGHTWEELIPADNYNSNRWIGCSSYNDDDIIIYGGRSHYMLSNDGGATWKNDSVPNTGGTGGADINCLKMLNGQTWWGAFDYDYIGRTSNSGDSWTKQQSEGPGGMWLLGIDYFDNDIGVIVGESSMSLNGKILNTIDGGNTWILSDTTDVHMIKVSFIK